MSKEKTEKEATEPKRAAAMPAKKVPAVKPMRRAAKPVEEGPRKVSPKTVRGKIAAIQTAAVTIQKDVERIQTDITGKTEVFKMAVSDIYSAIEEQMKENQEAAATIQSGVRAIQSAIRDHMKKHQVAVVAMQSAIPEQMKENQAYVRDFYG